MRIFGKRGQTRRSGGGGGGSLVAGPLDRREQDSDGRLLGIVDHLGLLIDQEHLDGGNPWDRPERGVHVLHATVAGHARDP